MPKKFLCPVCKKPVVPGDDDTVEYVSAVVLRSKPDELHLVKRLGAFAHGVCIDKVEEAGDEH